MYVYSILSPYSESKVNGSKQSEPAEVKLPRGVMGGHGFGLHLITGCPRRTRSDLFGMGSQDGGTGFKTGFKTGFRQNYSLVRFHQRLPSLCQHPQFFCLSFSFFSFSQLSFELRKFCSVQRATRESWRRVAWRERGDGGGEMKKG